MNPIAAKNVVIRWTGSEWIVEFQGPSGVYLCKADLIASSDETDEELIWRASVEIKKDGLTMPDDIKIERKPADDTL
jgi:hypothetical protein